MSSESSLRRACFSTVALALHPKARGLFVVALAYGIMGLAFAATAAMPVGVACLFVAAAIALRAGHATTAPEVTAPEVAPAGDVRLRRYFRGLAPWRQELLKKCVREDGLSDGEAARVIAGPGGIIVRAHATWYTFRAAVVDKLDRAHAAMVKESA